MLEYNPEVSETNVILISDYYQTIYKNKINIGYHFDISQKSL